MSSTKEEKLKGRFDDSAGSVLWWIVVYVGGMNEIVVESFLWSGEV
jgi:hypothetical protein